MIHFSRLLSVFAQQSFLYFFTPSFGLGCKYGICDLYLISIYFFVKVYQCKSLSKSSIHFLDKLVIYRIFTRNQMGKMLHLARLVAINLPIVSITKQTK